jgi:hypothetical protein
MSDLYRSCPKSEAHNPDDVRSWFCPCHGYTTLGYVRVDTDTIAKALAAYARTVSDPLDFLAFDEMAAAVVAALEREVDE